MDNKIIKEKLENKENADRDIKRMITQKRPQMTNDLILFWNDNGLLKKRK